MNKKIEFLDLGLQPLANYYLTKKTLNRTEKKIQIKNML